MCGIVAVIDRSGAGVDDAFLRRATDAVEHRGPDGSGLWADEIVGLGHRRLAILDLSNDGAQPMSDLDRYVLTFNGEIYNYREIRLELESSGRQFKSETDSEVLLAAYVKWGDACVDRFNGMWSFAIYDRLEKTVFCSRDRFGIKPLYFCEGPKYFGLASEITQLLEVVGERKLAPAVFSDFLVAGFLEHNNESFFQGIRKLPPGCNLKYWVESGKYEISRYYQLERELSSVPINAAEAAEQLTELIRSSVKLRLRADVKVGTCLSGGLDSSGIATLAADAASSGSGGFCAIHAKGEDNSSDESKYALALANAKGLDLHIITPTFEDFQSSVDKVVAAQGEPFAGTSIFMQYFVMQAAREHGCKVMLDGQGGDEVFLGYEKYYPAAYLSYARRNPLRAWHEIASSVRNSDRMTPASVARFTIGSCMGGLREQVYRRQNPYLKSGRLTKLEITRDIARSYWDHRKLQQLELERTNLPVLLRYEDRNSMAHSVEARVPYLDYRVVEFAVGLDVSHKVRDGWAKYVLRKALSEILPKEIAWRRDKFGFNSPHDLWMRRHFETAREEIRESDIIGEYCDRDRLLEDFNKLDSKLQWRLYNTAVWERLFAVTL